MTTQAINRREMTQDDRYVYSMSRAAKILGIKENEVEFVYVVGNGQVLVGLFNNSVYLTEREFKVIYGEERKARAVGFKVTKRLDDKHSYSVRNEAKKSVYKVSCYTDHIMCDCPDHEISRQIFNSNKVACKHIYSVLGLLGFNSLNDYVKGKQTNVAII